jgi:hypothetical protein
MDFSKVLQAEKNYLQLANTLSEREVAIYLEAYPETALFGLFKNSAKNQNNIAMAEGHANYHNDLSQYHQAHSILHKLQGNANEAEHHANLSTLHKTAANHFNKAAKNFSAGRSIIGNIRMNKGYTANNGVQQYHATNGVPAANLSGGFQNNSSSKSAPRLNKTSQPKKPIFRVKKPKPFKPHSFRSIFSRTKRPRVIKGFKPVRQSRRKIF